MSSRSFVQIVCPKCTVLSDIATISPLTDTPDGRGAALEVQQFTKHYLNKSALLNFYYSFVYAYLLYFLEACGYIFPTQIDWLFLLQKEIICIIPFSHHLL